MSEQRRDRFPGPFEVQVAPGAEGWESLYPYYYLFSQDRKEYEEAQFWYQDALHHPEPLFPFDTITSESWWVGLGQNNSRIFMVPPAMGIDQRVLNGYLYISPVAVTDPAKVQERLQHFLTRAGYYYRNWDELYGKWKTKATATIEELERLVVPALQEMEDERVVTEAVGISSGYTLLESYDRALANMYRIWQLHFEFLNLGYAAYLTFSEFCKKAFPSILDQTIARMVAGIDVLLYRPDGELKRLAGLAVKLDLVGRLSGEAAEVMEHLSGSENGRRWLAELEQTKHPWFYFSRGTGFYHHHGSWIDDLNVPLAAIRDYAHQIAEGKNLDRPTAELARQRDELAAEYGALLSAEADRKGFEEMLGLARTVFPYVEEHNFYVEHWHHTVFWNKIREFGQVLSSHGFFTEADDIFYLHRFEVHSALYDLVSAWASGGIARGPQYWQREVARRKEVLSSLRRWTPAPALGKPPETISEPFTNMLWGITTERVQDWLRAANGETTVETRGFAGSPGVVEGAARCIQSIANLQEVQDGEILVCPITTPSMAPVFTRIKAVVTDIGGIMSHAAIVCREYGVPAVVGTGFGTQTIRTGQRIRVNGNTGVVTRLDDPGATP